MTRLGFVIGGTGTGGTERYLLRLLGHLPQGVRVTVFVRSETPGRLHDDFARTGATLVYGRFGYGDPRRLLRVWRQLAAARLDTLVDLTGIFAGLPLALARMAGVPRRIAFHRRSTFAFTRKGPRGLFARATIALVEATASAILSNSRAALELFHPALVRTGDPRLGVVPNILERAELRPRHDRVAVRATLMIPEDAAVLLHVGRVDPAKDHATLLAAMARVLCDQPGTHAVLAGPGTEELRERYSQVFSGPAGRRFHMLGDRRDVADLYHAADVFVFPSRTEGQPNALLEAMACGLSVVASDIPSIREIVPERGRALLVAPGNVEGFATAIAQCLAQPEAADARRYRTETLALTDPETILAHLFSLMLPAGHDAN